MNCKVCEKELCLRWTDTHGVGVCTECGTPYRILYYDTVNNSFFKHGECLPEECLIEEDCISKCREYWADTGCKVAPGSFDLGFGGNTTYSDLGFGGNTTYSGATLHDIETWNKWMNERQNCKKVAEKQEKNHE